MRRQFSPQKHRAILVPLLQELQSTQSVTEKKYAQLVKSHTLKDGSIFSKDQVIAAARAFFGQDGLNSNPDQLIEKIRMKPTRTLSGVAPITVLTKPFPCPGKCIFCPSDVRMPKSYLADEPGAQRAERNYFDPYLQTYNRLQALTNIGHPVDKAEVIILGGTWSYYPESYQIWFIKQCFRALNDFASATDGRQKIEKQYQAMNKQLTKQQYLVLTTDPQRNKQQLASHQIDGTLTDKSYNQTVSELYVAPEKLGGFDQLQTATWQMLERQQKQNETSLVRCVGLVVETRPDNITRQEVVRLRRLGCTKTQIGVQSLNDSVLKKNHRGHKVAATRRAFKLLRQAGLKIHAHWMANLYGSNVKQDKADFDKLFTDPDFHPDELKIYPCSLIGSAELMQYYHDGRWRPYSQAELLDVVTHVLTHTPEYCRLTRIIRDIPSTDIVTGNKYTNFRQIAERKLQELGRQSKDIRAREIRQTQVKQSDLKLDVIEYQTSISTEYFLQYVTKQDHKIVAFLRLSLPTQTSFIAELAAAAIIREIHVYGSLAKLGSKDQKKSQHFGLGTQLIDQAKQVATKQGYKKLAVISAVGTREYYRNRGFVDGKLYQFLTYDWISEWNLNV